MPLRSLKFLPEYHKVAGQGLIRIQVWDRYLEIVLVLDVFVELVKRLWQYHSRPDISRRHQRRSPSMPPGHYQLVSVLCSTVEIYSFLAGCSLLRRKCLGALVLSKDEAYRPAIGPLLHALRIPTLNTTHLDTIPWIAPTNVR